MQASVDWHRSPASFGKSRRLLTAAQYSRVFDGADAKASHRNVLLLAKRNCQAEHRLGLVIAKKNVRLAVQRNRIKRIAREVFRRLPEQPQGLDVVVLARRGIDQLDNAELAVILQEQWSRLARFAAKPDADRDS
ncbi:ribonuclease P protein component [Kineobactrum salinum]|uniref:Ribonuclease P protein component n=1 Tax=Kineobactrum salinum TaxID=2708301 RepID=A0A6C0U2B7_9GAMM|nr:ribonuclease P protein component [Kineobactrum salinum]QIB65609.1 ribonuclease P protein component [Kineobactrum salinum]